MVVLAAKVPCSRSALYSSRQCKKALRLTIRHRPRPWDFYIGKIPVFLVIALACCLTQVGVYHYWGPIYDHSIAILLIAEYFAIQLLLNLFSMQWAQSRDSPHYQLERLGIKDLRAVAGTEIIDYIHREYRTTKDCKLCQKTVPFRSVHCPWCDECILRNDHHCLFIGNCVGILTTRYFCLIMIDLFALGLLGVFTVVLHYWNYPSVWADGFPAVHEVSTIKDEEYTKTDLWSTLLSYHSVAFLIIKLIKPNPGIVPHLAILVFSVLSICLSGIFLIFQILSFKDGIGDNEQRYFGAFLRGEKISFREKLHFMFGSRWYLNLIYPRWWEDVEWTPSTVDSVLINPFKPNTNSV